MRKLRPNEVRGWPEVAQIVAGPGLSHSSPDPPPRGLCSLSWSLPLGEAHGTAIGGDGTLHMDLTSLLRLNLPCSVPIFNLNSVLKKKKLGKAKSTLSSEGIKALP